jgi:hypothetical protein
MQDELLNPRGLGFGMLRIDSENADHREALRGALVAGVDLFDLGDFKTEPARFAAKSDLLLGLVAEYAAGPIKILVRGNLGAGASFIPPKMDSRVAAKTVWVYLVADPEFALPALQWDSKTFYETIATELDHLESRARKHEIAMYGIASAALTFAKEDPEALALEPILFGRDGPAWDTTNSGNLPENRRHFGFLEFPFNLYESHAATEENQLIGAAATTLLDAATRFGIQTAARRPLDAVTAGGLRRLVAYPDHHRIDLHETVRRTLETALAAEAATIGQRNHARSEDGAHAKDLDPLWAHRLRDQLKFVNDPEQWKEILRRKILPELAALPRGEASGLTHYHDAMDALLLAVKLWCEKSAAEKNERLRAKIVEAAPTLGRNRRPEDRDLALVALRIYRSVPGLDYILLGMRSPKYVRSFTRAAETEIRLPREELRAALIAAHTELEKGST